MFNSHTAIEKLNAEVLINITSFLDVASLLQFSLSAKAFRHLIRDELVFRRLVERDYRVTTKPSEKTWVDIYKEHKANGVSNQVATEQVAATEEEGEDIIDTTTVQEDVSKVVVEQEETVITQTIVEEEEEQTINEPSTEVTEAIEPVVTEVITEESNGSTNCPHWKKFRTPSTKSKDSFQQ
ncbi:unnamed protein product [Mucor hiemalis]